MSTFELHNEDEWVGGLVAGYNLEEDPIVQAAVTQTCCGCQLPVPHWDTRLRKQTTRYSQPGTCEEHCPSGQQSRRK